MRATNVSEPNVHHRKSTFFVDVTWCNDGDARWTLVPVLDAHHSETLQKLLQLLMDGQ